MEWRGLGGRLQRSLVTAASFMDYGSLVVINALLRTMGPSLLRGGFLEHIFAIRHKARLSIAAEMETLSWIGQNSRPHTVLLF